MIFPQLLLCGLFTPRPNMHPVLEAVSNVLPMSYAVDAMNEVLTRPGVTGTFVRDLAIVASTAPYSSWSSAPPPCAAAPPDRPTGGQLRAPPPAGARMTSGTARTAPRGGRTPT